MTTESEPAGDKPAAKPAETGGLLLDLYLKLKQALGLPTGTRFTLYWHLSSTLAGFLVAAGLIFLDPFDLDRGISAQGRSIFYKVASFAYPQGQSHAVVVLLDDDYLRLGSPDGAPMTWPVRYGAHAEALRYMAKSGARAIFIDFFFLDRREDPELQDLLDAMRDVAEEIPIFLAAPLRGAGSRARPEIEQLVDENPNISFVTVRDGSDLGQGAAYPMIPFKETNDLEVPANLKDAEEQAPSSEQEIILPAAVALARDYCRPSCNIRDSGAEMDIWWAAPRGEFNCRGEEARGICDDLPHSWIVRAFQVLTSALLQPLPPDMRWLIDPIKVPYTSTIGLLDLVNAKASWAHEALRGATVFYGGGVSFAGDVKENPVNERLAGVYTHAMAYDNLVALNGRYIQAGPPFGWHNKTHVIALTGLLALLALITRVYFTLRRPRAFLPRMILHDPERRARRLGAMDAGVFFTGALLIAVFEFFVGHIGPGAWAPVLVAATAGDLLSSRLLTAPVLGRLSGYSRLVGGAGRRLHLRRKREKAAVRAARARPT